MTNPSKAKKRALGADRATEPTVDDVMLAQQAMTELLDSKPEGYDLSRNAATARKQLDCHKQCRELIHEGKDMDPNVLVQLEAAMQDMADNSPAAKIILDSIDNECDGEVFESRSAMMRWKMLRMRERMAGNAQVVR